MEDKIHIEKKFYSTFVLPVNETKGMRTSFDMAWPTSAPPQNAVKIAPGKLFFSKTPAISFVIAIVANGVVGAPFLSSCHAKDDFIHTKLVMKSINCNIYMQIHEHSDGQPEIRLGSHK